MTDIKNIIDKTVLIEGAVIERIIHEFRIDLDPDLLNASLVTDIEKRKILIQIYNEYIDIAKCFNLPILILTPTWKVNAKSCGENLQKLSKIIRDCCEFTHNIKNISEHKANIYIGGLTGVINDSYNPSTSLSCEEAYSIHKRTINEFSKNEEFIDFLIASTLPSLNESYGIAKAMSDSSIPYFLSFVIRNNGTLLDGNSLIDAIERIDNNVKNIPLGYLINCVHPQNAYEGIQCLEQNISTNKLRLLSRLKGIQGNTSKLSPENLDGSKDTYTEDPEIFASEMNKLKLKYNLNIIGGCCGTDKRHILSIAKLLISTK
jgi:homocysteine S-methyltransferase